MMPGFLRSLEPCFGASRFPIPSPSGSWRSRSRYEDWGLPGAVPYAQIPELAERGRKRVGHFFDMLDARLSESDFVAGPAFTVADIGAMVAGHAARIGDVAQGLVRARLGPAQRRRLNLGGGPPARRAPTTGDLHPRRSPVARPKPRYARPDHVHQPAEQPAGSRLRGPPGDDPTGAGSIFRHRGCPW